MDVQALSAQQMANIIRLEVFMDNHQTQGKISLKNKPPLPAAHFPADISLI